MNNSLEATLQQAVNLAERSVQLAAKIEHALCVSGEQERLWRTTRKINDQQRL